MRCTSNCSANRASGRRCWRRTQGGATFEDILFPRNPIHEHACRLARFLTHLKCEDVPSDLLHTAKLVTLDTIGCIVAGTCTTLGEEILAAYGDGPQQNVCSVAGTALRLGPSLAAKVNG
ncbi:MmgE/PrpD family protein [Bradyrhizobium sp. CCBAU 21360]|uniref:MmgE/PrpD family protein n=1 Tax=Bradyrhizobium sp. CCBAU 21360 TaxID=1325081 RepID=UPI003FA4454B